MAFEAVEAMSIYALLKEMYRIAAYIKARFDEMDQMIHVFNDSPALDFVR